MKIKITGTKQECDGFMKTLIESSPCPFLHVHSMPCIRIEGEAISCRECLCIRIKRDVIDDDTSEND